MAFQVSFKVTLITKDQQSQAKMFAVPMGCNSIRFVKDKVRSAFPGEPLASFKLTWKDEDGDLITADSDEELALALRTMKGPIYKFTATPCPAPPPLPAAATKKKDDSLVGLACRFLEEVCKREEIWTKESYGSHKDVMVTPQQRQRNEWSIEGKIRQINVKTRLWDGRKIVQGIQVFLENGMTKAFGMNIHDEINVKSLEVPRRDRIATVYLRSGWYIDAIGLKTSLGKVIGMEGGCGGDFDKSEICGKSKDFVLDGIKGITVMTQGAPCICELQFKFVSRLI